MQCAVQRMLSRPQVNTGAVRGPLTQDVNSRAVLGCLHTGIGETHLNSLLCTLNFPPMNAVTFKSRENEIGHAVEQVTRRSCKTAMSEERNAAIKKGIKADEQGCINIPCSYDMGWQKWGKGHNSLTGLAAVMGLTYGKVMDYTTRTKSCRVCTNAKS